MVQQKIVLQNSEIVLSRGLCLLNKNEINHSYSIRFSKNGVVKHRIVLQNSEIFVYKEVYVYWTKNTKAWIVSKNLKIKCLW